MQRSAAQPIMPEKNSSRFGKEATLAPGSVGSSSSTNGMSRNSLSETPLRSNSTHIAHSSSPPRGMASANSAFTMSAVDDAVSSFKQNREPVKRRGFTCFDTRTNATFVGAPAKWKEAGKPSQAPAKSPEARAMSQSYQQFIALKILLSESRRYAWENIVLRHPEAAGDEVLVYQFNSTWGQLIDDVTTAIVERQVPNVAAASSVINMMELFQRHSPAVDLLPDCTPPIGPRHLPIDWFEAQRPDIRVAVVEERQARKSRAVMRASPSKR